MGLVGRPQLIKAKKAMRARLEAEQGHRCCYCGVRFGAWVGHWTPRLTRATLEHIIPRCEGGSDDWENLAAACLRCNKLRANEPALEFFARKGWIINHRDRANASGGWLARAIRHSLPEAA